MGSDNVITIDFETRSEVDLPSVGAWVYAEHPSTEIMCFTLTSNTHSELFVPDKFKCGFKVGDILSGYTFIPDPARDFINLHTFEAHNAEFERAIWYHICHKRWGWPDIPIHRWRCSAAKASALSLERKLESVGRTLELTTQKDMVGHKLMQKMCKPRTPKKPEKVEWLIENGHIENKKQVTTAWIKYAEENMPALWHETPEQLITLFNYCIKDVETEACLSEKLRDLTQKEQALWFLDQKINTRGVYVDMESVDAVIDILKDNEEMLLKEVKTITNGVLNSTNQVAKFKDWLTTKGVVLPNLQKPTIEEALKRDDLAPKVKRMLAIRQSLGKSSTAKYKKIKGSVNADGRCRGAFMFHGASTGRWAGKMFQPQNLPRPEFTDADACLQVMRAKRTDFLEALWYEPMRAAASCIRSVLVPADGKRFICSDFKAIELCVRSWCIMDPRVLGLIFSGKDVYKYTASSIYPVRPDKVSKFQRQIGKVAELALGYGGSVGAFQQMAGNYGVHLEDEKVKPIVAAWRESNPLVVKFWRANEAAVLNVLRTGKSQIVGPVKWGLHGDFLFCKLPSGRLMAYYKPDIRMADTPWGAVREVTTYMGIESRNNKNFWTRLHTYGGKLVENIVQAIARDLLSEAMLRVDQAGYPIVLHVHDEIVAEVDQDFGSLEEFEKIMSEVPYWAEGCPVSCDGWVGQRYKK